MCLRVGIYLTPLTIEYLAGRVSSCCGLAPFKNQYNPTLMVGKELSVLCMVRNMFFSVSCFKIYCVFQCTSLLITEFSDLPKMVPKMSNVLQVFFFSLWHGEDPSDQKEYNFFQTWPAHLFERILAHLSWLLYSATGFADRGVNLDTLNWNLVL